jgi:hypothetical protein
MTLIELFAAIRASYVRELAEAIAASDAHVEPAFRNADGELAVDGPLALPYRADFIPKNRDGTSVMVDSKSSLDFEPVTVEYGPCRVRIAPFVWDWMQVTVHGMTEEATSLAAKAWFLRWFDTNDTNEADEQGLYGVVHYLGEPKAVDGCIVMTIDFGSAPAEALDELLETLAAQGATEMKLA